MNTTTRKVHFTVDPDGITQLIRDAWAERNYSRALKLTMEGFGISIDQALRVISGQKRFVSKNGIDFDLADDELVQYDGSVAPPSIAALIERLGYLEKLEPALEAAKEFSCIIHAGKGVQVRDFRGNTSHASPIGYINAKLAIEILARHIPEPNREVFEAFWNKWNNQIHDDLDDIDREREARLYQTEEDTNTEHEDSSPLAPKTSLVGKYRETIDSLPDAADTLDKALELLSKKDELTELDKKNKEFLIHQKMAKIGQQDPLAVMKERDALWDRPCPDKDSKLAGDDGWILRNGDFYACGHMEHIWLATVLLEKLGNKEASEGNAERIAEKLGWCKISHGLDRTLYIQNVERDNTQKQRDTLFDWCEIHGVNYDKYVDKE